MRSSIPGFFLSLLGLDPAPAVPDGFGQSIGADLRYLLRFRRCRRIPVAWRRPTAAEAKALDADPLIGRFGDTTIAVADVAGRRWSVREQDWYGWPDPPRFAWFAMEEGGVWAAADFNRWPARWQAPPAEA
ncbi:hypothetical protein ACBY01_15145 [Sphingomonas sp. ac-8]|uniref:hypothetical protein n=1 Tax=Sphingomonas sp. ac-8 TaxID=3242977 RepID=UPI003A803379